MKNTWLLILIALILMPISACKKGSDDPAISFRSRNQRLIGKWKIVECNISETEFVMLPGGFSCDTSITTTTFKDNKAIRSISWRNNPATIIPFEAFANIEFKSDGTLNYTEGSHLTVYWVEHAVSGFWSWQNTAKRKYTIEISAFNDKGLGDVFVEGIFKIKQLSYDQITLESSNKLFFDYPDSRESSHFTTTTFCRLEREK
jgi:hypothetical protein